MHKLFHFLLFMAVVGCSTGDRSNQARSADTTEYPPPPPLRDRTPVQPPAAIAENLSLIGAVVDSVEILDEKNFRLHLQLRTAIPSGGKPSLADPGQNVVVAPAFVLDERGAVQTDHDRNQRLLETRLLVRGDFLMGKITLEKDGSWYLLDTRLD